MHTSNAQYTYQLSNYWKLDPPLKQFFTTIIWSAHKIY